jgi:adenylate kinase family enzyme
MRFNEFSQPIEEGVHDPHIFKAIFMAGSPGSGKSTVANKLFTGTGLKFLNVDDFYNLLRTKETATGDPETDYIPAKEKFKKRKANFLDGRLGIIIDGTGKNPQKQADMKAELEGLGYEVAMVFVNTSLETSLERAERRAKQDGKDFGREIDPRFVKDTWLRVQRGLGQLQSMFGNRFFIIDNNRGEPNLQYVQKAIDRWLNAPPQSHIAKEWIKNELEAKQTAGGPSGT